MISCIAFWLSVTRCISEKQTIQTINCSTMASSSTKRSHAVYVVSDDDAEAESATSQAKKPKTKGVPFREGPGLWAMITSLPAQTTNQLLYELCQIDATGKTVQDRIENLHKADIAAKAAASAAKARAKAVAEIAAPAVNFDSYSRTCWHALNTEHKRSKSSKQFEAASEVYEVLTSSKDKIMSIAEKGTRWETRRNALEVLRKITKSIILCELQVIRHELLKSGDLMIEFADAMFEIVHDFSHLERQRYKDEGLYEKLHELQYEDDDITIEGLDKVYWLFGLESDEESDE